MITGTNDDDHQSQDRCLSSRRRIESASGNIGAALTGRLPIAVQIPVYFSLYKVLFVTIEMPHAPFFGRMRLFGFKKTQE